LSYAAPGFQIGDLIRRQGLDGARLQARIGLRLGGDGARQGQDRCGGK
jgi:hypothetical protein